MFFVFSQLDKGGSEKVPEKIISRCNWLIQKQKIENEVTKANKSNLLDRESW
jgi:hypothetical protein